MPEPVDITDPDQYATAAPLDTFAELRARPGLTWHPYGEDGFWAVTRHADVREVSRRPDLYSSAVGHTNLWDLDADALEARRSLIDTDAPDHTRLRRLVASAFTPRTIRSWEPTIRRTAGELLDGFVADGGGDWVQRVAAPLPIRVILAMIGVPLADADRFIELSEHLVGGTADAPTLAPDAYGNSTELRLLPFASAASHALFEYGDQLRDRRRAAPADDLVSHLVRAEASGAELSDREYRNLFHLLVFAGNETTRTALARGAIALAHHPAQWDAVRADRSLVASATDEILRWSTPVLHMRRTATRSTELAGTEIDAGDKVVMWYVSANHDETVFTEPGRFDVRRTPNDHVSFGGGGPHHCLGAFLARLEISVLLEEMAARSIRLEPADEPVLARSNFVHGVVAAELRCRQGV